MRNSFSYRLLSFLDLIVLSPIRYLPRPLVAGLSTVVGSLVFWLVPKRRKLAVENVRKALGPENARFIARRSFIHMIRVGIETFQLSRWKGRLASTYRAEGEDHLAQALAEGRGAIGVVSHLGNWEYGAAGIADAGYPVAMMVRPPSNAWARDRIQRLREDMGIETISRKRGLPGLRKALQDGKIVLIALDQHSSSNSVTVQFFGRPARTVNVASILALRYRIPIIRAFTWRGTDGFYARILPPLIPERSGNLEKDILDLTQSLTQSIEDAIREHPDQWLWMHNRWRVREEK